MFMKFLTLVKRKKKTLIIIGIILAVSGFIFYQRLVNGKEEIQSTQVKRGNLEETLILSGEIKADKRAELRFQTTGQIASIKVKEGDSVQKGQLIALLDQRQLQKTLKKDLNDFLNARWDLDQQRDDYKDKALTVAMQRILDKTQFDLDNAITDVEIQQISIEYSQLFSPLDGIVTSTNNLQPGMNITAATAGFEIISPDSLYFEVTADQTEISKLQSGLTGKLLFDSYLDEEIVGTVDHVAFVPKANETGTVYAVKMSFINMSNGNLKYRVGMTGDVEFITQSKNNTLYIPFAFLQEDDKGTFVYIIKNNKKTRQTVTTGIETDEFIEILSGLSKGDMVYD